MGNIVEITVSIDEFIKNMILIESEALNLNQSDIIKETLTNRYYFKNKIAKDLVELKMIDEKESTQNILEKAFILSCMNYDKASKKLVEFAFNLHILSTGKINVFKDKHLINHLVKFSKELIRFLELKNANKEDISALKSNIEKLIKNPSYFRLGNWYTLIIKNWDLIKYDISVYLVLIDLIYLNHDIRNDAKTKYELINILREI